MKFIDLKSQRFGRLVAVERLRLHPKRTHWKCQCDCGNQAVVDAGHLRSGHTQSCGCIYDDGDSNRKHSLSGASEYRIWNAMRQRCQNPKNSHYAYYGGRGIRVCAGWAASFESFFADMGPRPSLDHSIDRIDNDGNYEPENCRWATAVEQRKNQRRRLKVHGEIL